jgi:hypothetical protein
MPRTQDTCTIEGCDRPYRARGYCATHWGRVHRGQALDTPISDKRRDEPDVRFDRKWVLDPDTGCHVWQDHLVRGYGQFRVQRGQQTSAHRYAYEQTVGPIPADLVLDHICHPVDGSCPGGESCLHRRCVNPDHLAPVTRGDNSRRCVPPHLRGATHSDPRAA